jgi:hypothetical protein
VEIKGEEKRAIVREEKMMAVRLDDSFKSSSFKAAWSHMLKITEYKGGAENKGASSRTTKMGTVSCQSYWHHKPYSLRSKRTAGRGIKHGKPMLLIKVTAVAIPDGPHDRSMTSFPPETANSSVDPATAPSSVSSAITRMSDLSQPWH